MSGMGRAALSGWGRVYGSDLDILGMGFIIALYSVGAKGSLI